MSRHIDEQNEAAYANRYSDPLATAARAEAIAREAETVGYVRGHAQALLTAGASRCLISDLETADLDLSRAIRMFRSQSDRIGGAHATLWLGVVAARRNDFRRALPRYRRALSLFGAQADLGGRLSVLHNLGAAYVRLRRHGRALHVFSHARRLAYALRDPDSISFADNNLATAYFDIGEHARALSLYREGLSAARSMGNETQAVIMEANIACAYHHIGRPEELEEPLGKSVRVLHERGLYREETEVLLSISDMRLARGNADAALAAAGEAATLARALGDAVPLVRALMREGEILMGRDQADQALEPLQQALELATSTELIAARYDAHVALGQCHERRGRLAAALAEYRAAHGQHRGLRDSESALRRAEQRRAARVERRRTRAEARVARAELQLLRAQLQPHFMGNALNSLAALMHRDVAAADEMLTGIAELLTLALRQSSKPRIQFREEVEFVSRYVAVEQIGRPTPIRLVLDVDPRAARSEVPHLLLQPLVENAIHHATTSDSEPLEIAIRACLAGGRLEIQVRDNGTLASIPRGPGRLGYGLNNTIGQLRKLYRSDYTFEFAAAAGGGVCVTMSLPHTPAVADPSEDYGEGGASDSAAP